jgi:hypothetical protein
MKWLFATLGVALLGGCHSAGPYGHAPHYAPLSEETAAVNGAREYDPLLVQRQPDEWRTGDVVLFGVVQSRSPGPGGAAYLTLGVRRLEPRNVCEDEKDESTCRVTVSDHDFGVVHALVRLQGDDDTGPRAVGAKSLLRLVGRIGEDVDPNDGAPVVHATYSRHFPPTEYTTKTKR